ncbi:MAG: Methyltransferase type 11 [uncultured Paraburkholderia sp.]|nr:MAG: Methyltransferase type 11 [uncultured Paraburkholderia sp.]
MVGEIARHSGAHIAAGVTPGRPWPFRSRAWPDLCGSSPHNESQLDDSLPDLPTLRARQETFDVVMLTAVWMHLDEEERRGAMTHVSALVRDHGLLIVSLRHGPVPEGRRMFDVSAQETIQLARMCGLETVLQLVVPSVQQGNRSAGVMWTRLAFEKRLPRSTWGYSCPENGSLQGHAAIDKSSFALDCICRIVRTAR